MERFFWVSLAGAIGSGARYAIGAWSVKTFGASFPYGTIAVNVLGCFLISAILRAAAGGLELSDTTRLTLTTGFLGGFTTYSSFNHETLVLLEKHAFGAAFVNLGVTTAGCLLAGTCGWLAGARLGAV